MSADAEDHRRRGARGRGLPRLGAGGRGGRRLGGTTGVAAIWLIYFASYESQTTVFELWGWAAALFKIVIGLALLIYVRGARNRDQKLIWHLLLTVGGYVLVAWGVLGLLLEFLPVSSLDQWRESP
jgi:hypothetical protein